MLVLICNAGSTSLKFKLYDMPSERVRARAKIERVGNPAGGLFEFFGDKKTIRDDKLVAENYEKGIRVFLSALMDDGAIADISDISAVGFKTVLSKGFYGVHVIDEDVMRGMEEMMTVAPAHNAHYLSAIRTFMDVLPDVPMVGAFETAFHQTMPPEAYIYSVPYEWYEKYGVRRLGYHGASHAYVAECLTEQLGEKYRAVSCHLGGSCSLCAIENGKSVDTSFGLSLQCGLPQSNRAGDFDPYLIFHMTKCAGKSAEEVAEELSKKSGLLGISGVSGDLRDVEEAAKAGNERAKLAVDIFCRELVRYIGGYAAVMGGIDAIAFTGGIGENSAAVRGYAMEKLAFLGVEANADAKIEGEVSRVSADGSKVSVFVMPANEELGVARKTYQAIK